MIDVVKVHVVCPFAMATGAWWFQQLGWKGLALGIALWLGGAVVGLVLQRVLARY